MLAAQAEPVPVPELPRSEATLAMMEYLEADPELMALMEKSIASAAQVNPDSNTNPVRSVDVLYDFLDWATICMPWNVLTDVSYPTLYESIDQSIDYIWFLLDQPPEELEDKGCYYPVPEYHEPIATWLRDYSVEWGAFLSTEESWNDIYYQRVKNDPSMNMQHGWYADTNVWHSFNEWFSRYLVDPSVRPIADSMVVSPADAKPQGIWDIDENRDFIHHEGVVIKPARFTSVSQLIGPDLQYGDAFKGGTLTHTFLDVNDYHRYHFPVSGTIVEMRKIPADNGVGGIVLWDAEKGRYISDCDVPGWQMFETRDCVIVDTEEYGLVAILPIGMSRICSCNWEENLKVGSKVEKGDPMGYFLFGGSDIVMVFQSCVDVEFLCETEGDGYAHILMGEPYANLIKK
ncbi:MAG: phosphatidylserine decarboxylase [Clostridia bacterium]|nr:phosphatidylserine decarboxylase [Clostridia bacterium]